MTRIPEMPETVILLEADEMCIGPYQIGDDCGCLVYWTDRVFPPRFKPRARRALVKELGIFYTLSFDIDKYTRQELAAGWNRAMTNQLGYDVECDRSEWEREQKKVGT